MTMTPSSLKAHLEALPPVRAAVVGDFCLDAYWTVDDRRSERSVETGLPTQPVREHRYSLGGAGNVAMNLRALGLRQVDVFGVTGDDPFGQEMRRLMAEAGLGMPGLLMQTSDWNTHVYIKPYREGAEQPRFDFGNFNVLADETARDLLQRLEERLPGYDVIVINEQVLTGIHGTAFFRTALNALIQRHPDRLFVLDSRHYHEAYPNVLHKMNAHEALRLCGAAREADAVIPREEVMRAAQTLYSRWNRPLFVTRGPRGCLVFDPQGAHEIPGIQILGRIDPVGAGDAFLAAVAAVLGAGRDSVSAATLGNMAATVVVQKIFQTGTATPTEILAVGSDPDYVYEPELAEDPRRARYVDDSEIEIIRPLPPAVRITHAIFDHDGTISTLRQGWEEVMEAMMIRTILGDAYAQADETLYFKVVRRVRDYINKTTGIQTIVQMKGLVEMVREFGCVPPQQIRDAAGYKAIYNDALMEKVRQRLAKLERGELEVRDVTMKNAVAFLQRLHTAGVRLYLASGTDVEDVIREAEALGYAPLFEGRIYGSVGAVERDAKRVVLERILNDIGPEASRRLVTFGDGPVEMRETHKRGGVAIGVASDEIRRFGLNPSKRARLIQAGADLVIPDFSQMDRLLVLLGFGSTNAR